MIYVDTCECVLKLLNKCVLKQYTYNVCGRFLFALSDGEADWCLQSLDPRKRENAFYDLGQHNWIIIIYVDTWD